MRSSKVIITTAIATGIIATATGICYAIRKYKVKEADEVLELDRTIDKADEEVLELDRTIDKVDEEDLYLELDNFYTTNNESV